MLGLSGRSVLTVFASLSALGLFTSFFQQATATPFHLKPLLNGSLIIVEGTSSPALSLFQNTAIQNGTISFEIDGEASFIEGGKIFSTSCGSGGIITLPAVRSGSLQDESMIRVTVNGVFQRSIRVFTTKREWFHALPAYNHIYGNATEIAGDNFAVIDESKVDFRAPAPTLAKNSASSFQTVSVRQQNSINDLGVGATITEDGETIFTKGLCIRLYVPCDPDNGIPCTTDGKGIMHWEIGRPRNLHSYKREFSVCFRWPGVNLPDLSPTLRPAPFRRVEDETVLT